MTATQGRRHNTQPAEQQPAWPGDPEAVTAADVAFEALACLLANTCRWGGRTRWFFSVAQHALVMAEEIETLEGVPDADRRALTLHALLADARVAWLGDDDGEPASAKAAERARRGGERIDRAVREAAGLQPDRPGSWTEILRLVDRMADAAERRDLNLPPPSGAAAMFPPLRRHVRPMRPERAGKLWLAKLYELTADAGTSEGDADRTGETAADAGTSEGDADRTGETAADAGPVPETEEQVASAP